MNSLRRKIYNFVPRAARSFVMKKGLFISDHHLKGYVILCYHSVNDVTDYRYCLSGKDFERHMEHVARWFKPVSLPELVSKLCRGEVFTDVQVAVTFDDGFLDTYRVALPVLEKYRVPATVFISSLIPDAGNHSYMNWDEVRALSSHQLFTIGSHGRTHSPLTALGETDIGDELRRSKAEIEARITRKAGLLAYPFGIHNDLIVRTARESGYDAACIAGFSGCQDLFCLNRLVIDPLNTPINDFSFELARHMEIFQ